LKSLLLWRDRENCNYKLWIYYVYRDRQKHQRKLDEIGRRNAKKSNGLAMLAQPSVMNLVRSPSEELRRHEEKVRKNKEFL
jgi:hypothetical protein